MKKLACIFGLSIAPVIMCQYSAHASVCVCVCVHLGHVGRNLHELTVLQFAPNVVACL